MCLVKLLCEKRIIDSFFLVSSSFVFRCFFVICFFSLSLLFFLSNLSLTFRFGNLLHHYFVNWQSLSWKNNLLTFNQSCNNHEFSCNLKIKRQCYSIGELKTYSQVHFIFLNFHTQFHLSKDPNHQYQMSKYQNSSSPGHPTQNNPLFGVNPKFESCDTSYSSILGFIGKSLGSFEQSSLAVDTNVNTIISEIQFFKRPLNS